MPQNSRVNEQGSALVYVFIGLALFAALLFTFSKSSNNSVPASLSAQDKIRAQAVIDYSNELAQTINRMLAKGISESDLSFENTVMKNLGGTLFSPASSYPNCTNASCKVFSPQGGNAVAARPLTDPVADASLGGTAFYTLPGMMAPHVYTIQGLGTPAPELVLTFHGFSKSTCAAINTLLGNQFSPNPPVGDDTKLEDEYKGPFTGSVGIIGDGDDPWGYGVAAQCHEFRSVPGFYVYQKAVIIR